MNIYALKGHKIRFSKPNAGYTYHQEAAAKYLVLNEIYTIEYTDVSSSSTNVYLQEVPKASFNSVMFEDLAPQPPALDQKHKDYKKYN